MVGWQRKIDSDGFARMVRVKEVETSSEFSVIQWRNVKTDLQFRFVPAQWTKENQAEEESYDFGFSFAVTDEERATRLRPTR
ncbi:hypothetical protein Csa_011302 [Cucumis sativus]|uniref:Uncharacterized protein n=1 Tax=Cucumis sativus TaxID=3659 RepID=A0A0A0L7Q0_CUCSA|nr:hypothetical protein Csa_011302 [Cucumis sativus]